MATILAAARDCASDLPQVFRHIESIEAQFGEHRFVAFENDSRDDTRLLLEGFCRASPDARELIVAHNFGEKISRTERLGRIRNTLLARARHYGLPLVIMMDVDEVNTWINLDGVRGAISRIQNGRVDVATASQYLTYYDKFALRTGAEPPRCRDELVLKLGFAACPLHAFDLQRSAIESAFGGFAIFRLEDAEGCAYDGRADCEHVAFNGCLRQKNARIEIVNELKNIGYDARFASHFAWALLLTLVAVVSARMTRRGLLDRA